MNPLLVGMLSTVLPLSPRAHQRARYALREDPGGISHWGPKKGSPSGDRRGRSTRETGRRDRRPLGQKLATLPI
jgi:hypothetical protein